MTNPSPCPTSERWQQHIAGTLSVEEHAELTRHLDVCEACRHTLDALAAGSQALLETARAAADPITAKTGSSNPSTTRFPFMDPPTHPEQMGRLAHYGILSLIGKGGFGIVFRALDEKLQRIVAIKVLSPEIGGSGTARKRFVREAQAAAAVKNEHVVAIHGVEDEASPPYLVMEMIEGISLHDMLNRDGPLELKEILRIGMQAAEGLAAAHRQGLVHRDIKPANILLENGVQRVKITDFGLARAVDDTALTRSGMITGTPLYMSPEQADGQAIDHRSDLFSLGTVLYAMCTGHSPFRASGTLSVLRRVCEDTPKPIREFNSDIPEWLCGIIARLHAKKPDDRFQTAKELAEVLGDRLAELQARGSVSNAPNHAANSPQSLSSMPTVPALPPSSSHATQLRFVVAAMVVMAVVFVSAIIFLSVKAFRDDNGEPTVSRDKKDSNNKDDNPRQNPKGNDDHNGQQGSKGNDKDKGSRPDKPPAPSPQVAEHGVKDFVEVHEVTSEELTAWVARMKKEGYRPISLSVRKVQGTPRFTSVALQEAKPLPWEFTHNGGTPVEVGRQLDAMTAKNFRSVAMCIYREQEWKTDLYFLWVKDDVRNSNLFMGSLDVVQKVMDTGRKNKHRLANRGAVVGESGRTVFTVIVNDDRTSWTDEIGLSLAECKEWVEKQKTEGWRPDHLYAYGSGAKTLFGAILIKDPDRIDWDTSWSLTKAEYETQLVERKGKGFRPHVAVAHDSEDGGLRFSVLWIRFRPGLNTNGNSGKGHGP